MNKEKDTNLDWICLFLFVMMISSCNSCQSISEIQDDMHKIQQKICKSPK
jgi:hypothetical protein